MRRLPFAFGAVLAAGSCHNVPAPALMADAPVTRPVCAPFQAWRDADLQALAAALKPVPEDSVLIRMALDWRRYYADAKACNDARRP